MIIIKLPLLAAQKRSHLLNTETGDIHHEDTEAL